MWLEYLGRFGSLKELVLNRCEKISQFDLLKFGAGWMKLQKFEFQIKGCLCVSDPCDPSCVEHCQYRYDFSCESLEDLTLARVLTEKEIGLRCLLRKCKALKNLCLYYVHGLQDNDMVTLSNNCTNLTSISLRLIPQHTEGYIFRTSLTDDTLKALALRCRKLQSFELILCGCDERWPEIGFTQEGLVMLIQSCPIRNLVLSGAHIFDDEGMKAISSAQFLESLELMHCINVTNAGMRLLAHCPCLINLTLRHCHRFSDAGVTEVARARKLETLVIEGCSRVPPEAARGAATSVHYKEDGPGLVGLGRV
jgi:F-box/leucine-rich repeat protein 2/20